MSTVQERPVTAGRMRPAGRRELQKKRSIPSEAVARRAAAFPESPTVSRAPTLRENAETPAFPPYPAAAELEAKDEIDSAVIRAIKTKQKRKRVKAVLLLKLGLVFVLGLLVVFRYASITEMGYKVSGAKTEYEQLTADNERLRVHIKSGMNLDDLTMQAKEKFGMQQPQTYQMVVLDIRPTDQTEVYRMELPEEPDNSSWYEKIGNSLRAFLGLI